MSAETRKRKRAGADGPSAAQRDARRDRPGCGVVAGLTRRELGTNLDAGFFARTLRPRAVLTLAQAIQRHARLRHSSLLGFIESGSRIVALNTSGNIECWHLDANRGALELDFEVTLPMANFRFLDEAHRAASVTLTEDGAVMVAAVLHNEREIQISLVAVSRACQHVASFRLELSQRTREIRATRKRRRLGRLGHLGAASRSPAPSLASLTASLSRESFIADIVNEDVLGFNWNAREHVLVLPLDEHAVMITRFCRIEDVGDKCTFPSAVPYCRWRWISSCAGTVHMTSSFPASSQPEPATTGVIILDQVRIDLESLLLRCIGLDLGIRLQGAFEEEEGEVEDRRGGSSSGHHSRVGPTQNAPQGTEMRDMGVLLSICVKTGEYKVLQSFSAPPNSALRIALNRLCKRLQASYPIATRIQRSWPRSVVHEPSVMSLAQLPNPSKPVTIVHVPPSDRNRTESQF
ncbi:Hypothetical Protein FCC1311_071642 [Hondaea fermentalgiana]|uniref:Uncharacterized protein n=1 Tax=Hondaea fermentalgiana TaxID=2315210 RepID=A0A2R5GQN7_9STRA|nr:Hypothetical Protein FCC1311_071642 [Hondaea fermentalgiana]|eukprot:GBG30943.1 Hypothetical Protein FCC1311_071642 [Hondaea fermentalgiana]